MKNWKPFWFEGNQRWGVIGSKDDWFDVLRTYGTTDKDFKELMNIKECVRSAADIKQGVVPKFGFSVECSGKKTLKEFFEDNNMEIAYE